MRVLENHASGKFFSIEKVGDELTAGSDELASWAATRGPAFFQPPTTATLPALATVSNWANRCSRHDREWAPRGLATG